MNNEPSIAFTIIIGLGVLGQLIMLYFQILPFIEDKRKEKRKKKGK